jgi:hypothetical protein
MSSRESDAQAHVERRARVLALSEKPGVEMVRLDCKPVGRTAWDCDWELSDGTHGGMRMVPLTIQEPPAGE